MIKLQQYKSDLEARLAEAERAEAEEKTRSQPSADEVEKFVRLQAEKVRK